VKKRQDIFWGTESLRFSVGALSGYLNAVVDDAVQDAGSAKDAEILDNAYLSRPPVEGVGGAHFDAEFAFCSSASSHVDSYASLFEVLFNSDGLKKPSSFLYPLSLGGF